MIIYFSGINIIPEVIMLFISLLMILLITVSKPEMTRQMVLCRNGFIISAIAIVFELLMYRELFNGGQFREARFVIFYSLFTAAFIIVYDIIFLYLARLSYKWRVNESRTDKLIAVWSLIFAGMVYYPLVTGRIIGTELANGRVGVTNWYYMYIHAGTIMIVALLVIFVRNRNLVSRAVFKSIMCFVPIDLAGLILQYYFPQITFSGASFVLPLLMFYLLFHCATYDEIVGAQFDGNMYSTIDRLIKKNKQFVLIYVRFPQLQKMEYTDIKDDMNYVSAKICRQIEAVRFGIRIYTHNVYTYMALAKVSDDNDADYVTECIKEIMTHKVMFKNEKIRPTFKMIVIKSNDVLNTSGKIRSIISMLNNEFIDSGITECIDVGEKELKRFEDYYTLEQEIFDISAGNDLDDERVLCYAQPIYSIDDGKYRTAEALMRMNINGRMYFPDQFIPAAENNNCIHALTMIMLNKVCKQIKAMEGKFEFEAITVNCSTEELEKKSFHKDVMDIIDDNEIDPSHIRLEITESIAVGNYENIMYNMKTLKRYGVNFYLDDFGTGYSNLERLISFPFTTIKFDKSIFYKALETSKAEKLLNVLVAFFTSNGFTALVEGVEDGEQSEYAKDRGFQYIQGYHYSKPKPVEQLTEYFEEINTSERSETSDILKGRYVS